MPEARFTGVNIHESEFQEALYYAVRKAKIPKKVTAHTFCHSFATHQLQAGYDICPFKRCSAIPA